ncbi:hypothetical protein AcW2_003961 [Taiwanofungus camphoratus]|nr:hypothetical protein AcW2_003961 [Antrodia cinnamomea]
MARIGLVSHAVSFLSLYVGQTCAWISREVFWPSRAPAEAAPHALVRNTRQLQWKTAHPGRVRAFDDAMKAWDGHWAKFARLPENARREVMDDIGTYLHAVKRNTVRMGKVPDSLKAHCQTSLRLPLAISNH